MSFCCPACESDKAAFKLGTEQSEYILLKCARCGLVLTQPMPDAETLRKYYQGFQFEPPDANRLKVDLRQVQNSIAHLCLGLMTEGKTFLDYGGGCGIYAVAAEQLGFQATLYDLDASSLVYAQKTFGLKRTADAANELERYDVIMAYHVIEHSSDLRRTFAHLASLLAPGGRLILATPNCAGFLKYLHFPLLRTYIKRLQRLGLSWKSAALCALRADSIFCWDPPRHLYALSEKSLQFLAEQNGLRGHTFCPYNTDIRYEPRQYVIPRLMRYATWIERRGGGSRGRWFIRNCSVFVLRSGLKIMAWLFPNRGGQLYGVFDRPLHPINSGAE